MITGSSSATNRKAFMYALQRAFLSEFVSYSVRPDHSEDERSGRNAFVELALRELGIDPSREIDDALIREVKPLLAALGVDYDECVETIEIEEEGETKRR
jgi:uncharacterized protein YdiU (UPF0061 family)